MKHKQEKRSPLKDKPLRLPGQSVTEMIDDKFTDILSYIFYITGFLVIIANDWIRFLFPPEKPVSPMLATIVVAALSIYFSIKIYKTKKEIDLLRMGRDGEKIVAEELQVLIKNGSTVIHDIVGDKFNIDHVVISKHGLFVLETKTYSKPIKQETKITFDDKDIYVDGYKVEREPIKQAKSLSKWLQELILQTTGKKFPVRPVIVFPGWWTEKNKIGQEVWVLNPKALPTFIANEPITIQDTDVHLITYHLSRYVRTH